MPVPDHYIPGVCNIGPAERRARQSVGWIGLAATLILAGLLFGFHAAPAWRLLLFFPAMSGASGFLQSALHFCLRFGFSAVFNFAELGKTDSVLQAEFRAQDRRKAQRILLYAVLIGAVVAGLAYLIP